MCGPANAAYVVCNHKILIMKNKFGYIWFTLMIIIAGCWGYFDKYIFSDPGTRLFMSEVGGALIGIVFELIYYCKFKDLP